MVFAPGPMSQVWGRISLRRCVCLWPSVLVADACACVECEANARPTLSSLAHMAGKRMLMAIVWLRAVIRADAC